MKADASSPTTELAVDSETTTPGTSEKSTRSTRTFFTPVVCAVGASAAVDGTSPDPSEPAPARAASAKGASSTRGPATSSAWIRRRSTPASSAHPSCRGQAWPATSTNPRRSSTATPEGNDATDSPQAAQPEETTAVGLSSRSGSRSGLSCTAMSWSRAMP
jgi:hypothetical protein